MPLIRFASVLPVDQRLTNPGRRLLDIARDGTRVAYVANERLYVRHLSELDAAPVAGTEGNNGVSSPTFSPDGHWLAYYSVADRVLRKVPLAGGGTVTLTKAENPLGLTWTINGLYFGQPDGIFHVSDGGSASERIVQPAQGEVFYGPQLLPDGRHLLFSVTTGESPDRWDKARIVVQDLRSGERKILLEGGTEARYVPSGHLLYTFGNTLFAVPMDLTGLTVRGQPSPVADSISRSPGTGAGHYSVSDTGSFVYLVDASLTTAPSRRDRAVAIFDRHGGVAALDLPPDSYQFPRVSPDDRRLVIGTDDESHAAVWLYELSGGSSRRRLTVDGNNRYPIWAGNDRIVYQSDREGDLALFWQQADGTGSAERLTRPERGTSHVPEAWSPDGTHLLFRVTRSMPGGEHAEYELWLLSATDRRTTRFANVRSLNPTAAAFSSDGQWVTYGTDDSGSYTIWAHPFPSGERIPVSTEGNVHHPIWSRDGSELLYVSSAEQLIVSRVVTRPRFTFQPPSPAPVRDSYWGPPIADRGYDIMADGRLIMAAGLSVLNQPRSPRMEIVLNWFQELKARVPAGK
jgi:serine/threonine-protein kinase